VRSQARMARDCALYRRQRQNAPPALCAPASLRAYFSHAEGSSRPATRPSIALLRYCATPLQHLPRHANIAPLPHSLISLCGIVAWWYNRRGWR